MQRKFHPAIPAIPDQFSPLGLKLPANLSFEQWEATVVQLTAIVKGCLWWVGDALNYGERRWGQKYEAVLRATDYDYQTLRNAKWLASRIELSRRRDRLSWSHHLEVAAMEPEQQDELLDRAEAEKMTRDELRCAVRQLVRQAEEWKKEWQGMPEFVQGKQRPFAQLIVRFRRQEDLDDFARLIGQRLNRNSQCTWHPELKRGELGNSNKNYVDES